MLLAVWEVVKLFIIVYLAALISLLILSMLFNPVRTAEMLGHEVRGARESWRKVLSSTWTYCKSILRPKKKIQIVPT